MSDLRIGIIGSGYMARTFAECLRSYCHDARLQGVAGGTRAPTTAAEFGVEAVGSVEKLIERSDVDAVLVTSPHAAHRDQVIAAARAGKHVFVEKPMETSVARCDAMIEACERAGVTLCVAFVSRFRGSPRRGKELVDQGKIGAVRTFTYTWQTTDTKIEDKRWTLDPVHGGIFLDAGVHAFDQMLWYVGAKPTRVYANVTNFTATETVKPTAVVQVTFENGAIGVYWMSFELPAPGFPDSMIRTEVVGSKGLITLDPYGKVEAAIDGRWEQVWEQPTIDYLQSYLNPVRLEAFAAELQDFIDSVRDHRPPFATGQDGRAAVELVEAANVSSETGEAVRLPL
jgi:UDP-N-acetyl-2-amino-2-deoxyglucuronate dehydrogenase